MITVEQTMPYLELRGHLGGFDAGTTSPLDVWIERGFIQQKAIAEGQNVPVVDEAVFIIHTIPPVELIAQPELSLYDSATGDSVLATKIVDASSLCPLSARTVIKYATVERGLIAQLCDWYKADDDLGVTVHFFLNELTVAGLAGWDVFTLRCELLGADPLPFAQFIHDNAPAGQ